MGVLIDEESKALDVSSKATWSVTNEWIAVISKRGLFTGLAEGKASVILEFRGIAFEAPIQVAPRDSMDIQ
jgi:hypothetical protein